MKNTVSGKILKGVGGLYTVKITSKDSEFFGSTLRCRARGSFRHNNMTPFPGDCVTLALDESNTKKQKEESDFVIEEIVDRKNSLIRPPMANLDLLFVTMAAAAPTPILSTADKLISIAEHNGIEPIVVVTKCELDEAEAARIKDIYERCGITCFCLSAKENTGVCEIERFIKENMSGKTAAFAGASGIGKSTLINRLFPELDLSTAQISRKIERGRHTTRSVELFETSRSDDCGYIADTPGFSLLDFNRFDFFEKDDLVYTMREFEQYIGQCRYTKCSHTKEEGCAIVEAVKDGKIPKSRHESYVELYDILKMRKKWD